MASVDEVFALAGAEQAAGDGNFGGMRGAVQEVGFGLGGGAFQGRFRGVPIAIGMSVGVSVGMAVRVRSEGGRPWNPRVQQRHGDRRHAERLPVARTGEDYVFHAGAAQALHGLLAQDPADGVAQVGFSTPVRSHHGCDAGTVEAHLGFIEKRLEALNFDSFEFQQRRTLSTSIFSGVHPY